MIGTFWKSGSHWDFGENKNYESFAVYQQYYIKICHNNSKQWKKKAQKATKSFKKQQQMSSKKIFFFIFANQPTQKETNCLQTTWLCD